MIADNVKKGKPALPVDKIWLDRLLIPLIIVLVGVGAFGLGRLSALQENKDGLVIYPAPAPSGD